MYHFHHHCHCLSPSSTAFIFLAAFAFAVALRPRPRPFHVPSTNTLVVILALYSSSPFLLSSLPHSSAYLFSPPSSLLPAESSSANELTQSHLHTLLTLSGSTGLIP